MAARLGLSARGDSHVWCYSCNVTVVLQIHWTLWELRWDQQKTMQQTAKLSPEECNSGVLLY